MNNIYVISACRTPIGAFGGTLKDVSAQTLGSIVLKEAMDRSNVKPEDVDEVYFGCVLTAGLGQNVARQVSIGAGIPYKTTATTVNMVCGSGMKTVIEAARAIACGDADLIAVGGCENMSSSPHASPSARWGTKMGDITIVDTMIKDGLLDVYNNYHMGITAENICEKWNLTREQLDSFALNSQKKAINAIETGKFKDEIVPVKILKKGKEIVFDVDEYPKNTSIEALSALRPAFKKEGGMVTAGNASGLNDGAAALLIASEQFVKKHNIKPLAQLVGWGQAGVDPAIMGIGPVQATKNALAMAQMTIEDLDLVEANEAFAAQSVAVVKDLNIPEEKVNVNGGAIALGHPIGASGARIIVTLLYEMQKQEKVKNGLATLCIGGGMGVATIFKKC